MNILTIIVLAIFAICILGGYKEGFLKTAFSLLSWIIVLVLCNYATPIVTSVIVENTPIDEALQTTVDVKIGEIISNTLETSGVAELEDALPAELKAALLGGNVSLQDVVVNGALDTTVLVNGIVNIMGFLVTLVGLRIVTKLVELVLTIIGKLPLIGPLDKLLGAVLGVGNGLILNWILLAVLSVSALSGVHTEFATYISQSELLTWLQDNNLLLNLIVNFQ